MILEPIPKHIAKAVQLFKAGKLKPADIKMAENVEDVAKSTFEISLATVDEFGDPAPPHVFALSIESLVSTKQALNNSLNQAMDAVDDYNKAHDDVVAMLDAIKLEKDNEK